MRAPTPRKDIYPLYWQFAAKRQQAYNNRLNGAPRPWSEDPILERYKFCNVYRAADRVSQYLIRDVIYDANNQVEAADKLFQIVAFRLFSRNETWDGLVARLGRQPLLEDLASGALETALDNIKAVHGTLYTGAFILCAADSYGGGTKHRNHLGLLRDMFFESGFAPFALQARSLEAIVRRLEGFPLLGRFMSYQIATDLNYSDLMDFDENSFTQAGPGALRGIEKIFEDRGGYSPEQIVMQMVERQDEEFAKLGLKFDGLFGRKLHAVDCQGLFCEVDKYCREAAPQLVSNRSRIKAQFSPKADVPQPFFPPKWALDLKQPADSRRIAAVGIDRRVG